MRSWVRCFAMLSVCAPLGASGHTVYLAPDNHTDYSWNATPAVSDQAMLADLDYYRAQADATAASPPDEQSRYTADNWWFLWLYEKNRSPAEFADLVAKIKDGHITIPLNPFVTLYGAMSTEMAIRAGYYPGRIARRYGVQFLLGYPSVENATMPWGLAQIFSASGVRYAWKGICGCTASAPFADVPAELFRWEGADGHRLLTKWYRLRGANTSRGGYAEAHDNLSVAALADQIATTRSQQPGVPLTGLFGAGWDSVGYTSQEVVDAVHGFNAAGGGDRAVVSNEIDFFQALEGSPAAAGLPVLRGGFGADWDMWPASLAERTARQRRAVEQLRTVEAVAAFAQRDDPSVWPPLQALLESALTSTWKYFEHSWSVCCGGPTIAELAAEKEQWTRDVESAVASAQASAAAAVAARFATPAGESRVAVFNPLGFARTDLVDLPVASAGPYVVTDVATGLQAPSQVLAGNPGFQLRWLAADVPSLGYRVYRVALGTPSAQPPAASVTAASRTIDGSRYRVVLGTRGQIVSLIDKSAQPQRELAGGGALNDWGGGSLSGASAENVGPVSATLRLDLADPARSVRVTLYGAIDRVDVEDVVAENVSGIHAYAFSVNLASPQIEFEELGAIARPGLISQGGDYLPGTRASRLTLNHFVAFAAPDYHVVVSNRDAYAMQVGQSSDRDFDLPTSTVSVVVTDTGAGVTDQGGDARFLNRFALRGVAGAFAADEAMRTSLAHQNPLHPVWLASGHAGPWTAPTRSFLAIDSPHVVVTAFKPAEEAARGFVVRLWELAGVHSITHVDASAMTPAEAYGTSLIETDLGPIAVTAGSLSALLEPNQIATLRFTEGAADACRNGIDDDGDGLVDLADPGCASASDTSERNVAVACDDGFDNDGDGKIDLADPDCSSPADTSEGPPRACGLVGLEVVPVLAGLAALRLRRRAR